MSCLRLSSSLVHSRWSMVNGNRRALLHHRLWTMDYRLLTVLLSILTLLSCSSYQSQLKPTQADQACLQKFKPAFTSDWYKTSIDVRGHHLSGLLLFKTMPDKNMRVVFTNEVGTTFFDFEFTSGGSFTAHQVMNQINHKAVIQTLRRDIQLILMQGIDAPLTPLSSGNDMWYAQENKKETTYFVTDLSCKKLIRIETASKRKKKVDVVSFGQQNHSPDSVHLQHYNFAMQINLNRVKR